MKKTSTALVGVLLVLMIAGCSSASSTASKNSSTALNSSVAIEEMTERVSIDGLTFKVGKGWRVDNHTNVDGKEDVIIYPDGDTLVSAAVYDNGITESLSSLCNAGVSIRGNEKQYEKMDSWETDGIVYVRYDNNLAGVREDQFTIILGSSENGTGFEISFNRGESGEDSILNDETISAILDTVSFDGDAAASSANVGQTSETFGGTDSSPSAVVSTTLQSNALRMAKQYLDTAAFSHDGLIRQLEYEGFSTEDATFGADNCGADWNVQASKAAKQYLDMMAFSHDGLVEQLIYDGFTPEEAEYGASSIDL